MKFLMGVALGATFAASVGVGMSVDLVGRAPDVIDQAAAESRQTPPSVASAASEAEERDAAEPSTDATPYGQTLKAWKQCLATAAAADECGLRPRPKGHAKGWDKNGFADGTKTTGKPDGAGRPDGAGPAHGKGHAKGHGKGHAKKSAKARQ